MKLHFYRYVMWLTLILAVIAAWPDHTWWQTALNTLGVWSMFMIGRLIQARDTDTEVSDSWL